ncbi:Na+/H+ antiporter NhaA [Actinophytocola sp.]|uniref:Na+/H+ antiporter NhaA n=1 Tax=Actinophytocola sp. TaxID=1872138 RepID=UPI002D7E2895|nr:Na+/H+ antiporter NhaA [Actinophytocola sp.]HET9137957.1 Na+/H+ antiporter NhaA [Actinophytocola sp.]
MPLTPLREFLRTESAGGIVLLVAAVAAIGWANSPAGDSYDALWQVTIGGLDLLHWVNDGLMTLFFFLVGLEIKRELVVGELNRPRAAALPVIAALGGVLLPILVFSLVVRGGPGASGWGIPIATDVAFAVGVLALLGPRVPDGVRLFLLSVAIVDDIIAITVIAVFYTHDLAPAWLAAAALAVPAVLVLRRLRVALIWPYVLVGVAMWFAVHESGVHATITGVVLALLCPARPVRGRDVLPLLEHRLHPFVAFGIVPLFALANAGVDLTGARLGSSLTLGVVLGLLVGKTLGVAGATAAATATGRLTLPAGVAMSHVWGMAILAGIGFTVSLFIADLSLDAPDLVNQAKIGVLAASLLAGVLGATVLRIAARAGV